jgi:hypothetical protein
MEGRGRRGNGGGCPAGMKTGRGAPLQHVKTVSRQLCRMQMAWLGGNPSALEHEGGAQLHGAIAAAQMAEATV